MINIHAKMFRRLMLCAFAILTGLSFQSCSDDDDYPTVDGQAPTLEINTAIQTEPGRDFTITGVAKDADGLKSIRLVNDGLHLDKTIDFLEYYPDTLLHEYNLSYNYEGDDTWGENDSFPVEITVTDVGGRTTSQTVNVTTDGDFSAPTFTSAPSSTLTVLLQNPHLTLNAVVADNKNLGSINVLIAGTDINDTQQISGKSYSFTKVYDLPAQEGSYEMTITLKDAAGNTTTTNSTITVSDLPDFDRMYLADVDNVSDLSSDVYGVPMLIDHTGEYQYTAHYYNKKAGTNIRFIPQLTDFEPICFAVDPSTGLLTSDPSVGQPIQLNDVGYVEITFNTVTGEWDEHPWTPTTEKMTLNGTTTVNFNDGSGDQPAQICLAGSGLPDTPSWTTNQNDNAFILNQDANNPYRLYREMTLEKGTKISFTISQTHWWGWWPEPYWRFDGSDENGANKLNGGDNMKEMEVPATGTYLFEFDYALLRSRIIPVK